jgi:hypothetical protein
MKKILNSIMCLCLLSGLSFAKPETESSKTKRSRKAQEAVQIKIVPVGRSQEDVDRATIQVQRSKVVQAELSGSQYRMLSFEFVENESKTDSKQAFPDAYNAVFYDYSRNRTLVATGFFNDSGKISIREEAYQPTPSNDEFDDAVRILEKDLNFATRFKANELKTFRPMPDVTLPEGTNQRLVNVGLMGRDNGNSNEVISVDLLNKRVIRYSSNAPPQSKAAPEACGIPDAGQPTTSRGTAGQYDMVVSQNGSPLWEMRIIRPSASSGTRASGIEVQNVKYRGKSVMKRGNAPVLNVEYPNGACGPYRDWQYQEDQFATPATGNTDPAPGIRIVAAGQVATTALETGTDAGNFRGVAVYTQNNETVLVTELQAGWYRYIMEWRFANDGIIRPRFGFGATDDSCVCSVHNHHVYWRFDMDVVNPENNVFQVERGRKFLRALPNETAKLRNYATNRGILVQNSTGNEAYMMIPNITDGVADNYGRGDMWVLKYKNVAGGTALQNEIDDGYNQVSGSGTPINIGNLFMNNESIAGQDVVLWYGSHFIHSDGANLIDPSRNGNLVLSGSHVVGPDLRPVRW